MAYVVGSNLFLHVPKMGGKAVLSQLRAAGNTVRPVRSPGVHVGHAYERELRDRRYRWNFRFGFIRHPVAWWQSLRDFASTPGSQLFDIDPQVRHPFREIIPDCLRLKGATADEFVHEIAVVKFPGFLSSMLSDYYGADFSRVDWIGRTETLDDDLVEFCRMQGLRPTRPARVNVSRPARVDRLTASVVSDVESIEADMIGRFYGGRGTTGKAER